MFTIGASLIAPTCIGFRTSHTTYRLNGTAWYASLPRCLIIGCSGYDVRVALIIYIRTTWGIIGQSDAKGPFCILFREKDDHWYPFLWQKRPGIPFRENVWYGIPFRKKPYIFVLPLETIRFGSEIRRNYSISPATSRRPPKRPPGLLAQIQ